jgi:hypothetical protein
MLCVHVAGDELGTVTHDFRQNFFAISVNRCHLNQLHDASPRVPHVVRFSPSRLEFSGPLADQLTLQRPPLLIGQIGYSDLEHDSLLPAYQKPPTSEARMSHNLLASLQFVLQLLAAVPWERDFASMDWKNQLIATDRISCCYRSESLQGRLLDITRGLTLISISRTRTYVAVEEPKGAESSN